ncbi:NUDIX hydrolase [Frankia sp. R43]|uniref:NUDIX domain-containing protein n=1 Tax=Frankia sp. R43 TaxID=269536 RepID=UPI0006CA289C|nr:NUDIX hydrolase [Frankia sp. R43]KPM55973.1 NUDIX hydrolase [Frankia sp. R43]
MPTPPLPAATYYARLPRVIAAAGAIFCDANDRVLLVQPTYRDDTWEIPGGGMDDGEHPLQTAQREIREELGIDVQPGRLLVADWVPPQPDGRPALVHFVFDGGLFSPSQERGLRLQESELRAWRLCTAAECDTLLVPRLARRVQAAVRARHLGHTAYLHDGWAPDHTTA